MRSRECVTPVFQSLADDESRDERYTELPSKTSDITGNSVSYSEETDNSVTLYIPHV